MVATLTATRSLTVSTVLDKGSAPGNPTFFARHFKTDEALSTLFRATVDVTVDKGIEFTFDQLLGTPILVELAASVGKDTRYFHGFAGGSPRPAAMLSGTTSASTWRRKRGC